MLKQDIENVGCLKLIVSILVIVASMFFLGGFAVWFLWNYILTLIITVPTLGYWTSCVTALCISLIGNMFKERTISIKKE